MTNKHEQQPCNPTRRAVNSWLAGFVGSAVVAGIGPPWRFNLPEVWGTERPRTWETFAQNISTLSKGYGIDLAADNIDTSGLDSYTASDRELFRELHLASQELHLQAYQSVVTEKNRELIPQIFLTPQIGLTLVRDEELPEDGASVDPRTFTDPFGRKAYVIEAHYGVGMKKRLSMVPNEWVHQTYAYKPFRDCHPQIGDALLE